jgi:hypothetical protein
MTQSLEKTRNKEEYFCKSFGISCHDAISSGEATGYCKHIKCPRVLEFKFEHNSIFKSKNWLLLVLSHMCKRC